MAGRYMPSRQCSRAGPLTLRAGGNSAKRRAIGSDSRSRWPRCCRNRTRGTISAGAAIAIIAPDSARSTALRHQDQQFFDSFMLVIGILMGVAAGLFFLARAISIDTQGKYMAADPA